MSPFLKVDFDKQKNQVSEETGFHYKEFHGQGQQCGDCEMGEEVGLEVEEVIGGINGDGIFFNF